MAAPPIGCIMFGSRMEPTRSTLLIRLRDRSDEQAWRTFNDLYRPMLVAYARWRGLNEADADDIAQQCVQVVLERIGEYEHRASFKSWLRAIAEHKILDRVRRLRGSAGAIARSADDGAGRAARAREVQPATGAFEALAHPSPEGADEWERQWSMAHLRHCAEQARREVSDSTYEAFRAYAIDGREPGAVAAALGISVNQVYVAKHRVLERIRSIMLELTGEEPGNLVV